MNGWQQNFPWTASVARFLWPDGPARRKRWLKFTVALVVIVALHAVLTAFMAARTSRAADRFVARWGSLDPVAHRPGPVDDADNKARAVRAAAEILVLPPARAGGTKLHEDYASGTEGTLTAADREAIRRVVADNAVAFSLLDLAAARPGSNWDLHYERGMEMEIPPLLKIIQLAKLNVAAGRLALEDGRMDEALAAVRRGTALAASLDGEPVLIVQLIRLAVDRLDAGLCRRIVAGAELRPEQLAILRAAFPDSNPRLAIQRAMIVETGALKGVMAGGSTDMTSFSRHPRVMSLLAASIVRVIARPYLFDEERVWLTLMTARITELDVQRHARVPSELRPTLRWWNVLVKIVGFEDASLVERADLAEARDLLARAAIAVERHRRATGRTPATLAELVPGELPALPVDPLTGRAFRYETDGTAWHIRTEADVSSMDSARMYDPVLDWARP